MHLICKSCVACDCEDHERCQFLKHLKYNVGQDLKQCWSCLHHTQHVLNTNIKIHWAPNILIQLTCNEKIKIVNNSHYQMKTYVVFHLHLIKQFFIEIQGWIPTFIWKRGTWKSHLWKWKWDRLWVMIFFKTSQTCWKNS